MILCRSLGGCSLALLAVWARTYSTMGSPRAPSCGSGYTTSRAGLLRDPYGDVKKPLYVILFCMH